MVTGIEPTTSGLLDQRRSRSDNEANDLKKSNIFCLYPSYAIVPPQFPSLAAQSSMQTELFSRVAPPRPLQVGGVVSRTIRP